MFYPMWPERGRWGWVLFRVRIKNGSHCTWNQEWWCHSPHPHNPEASVMSSICGRWDGGARYKTPFHSVMNVFHHARSERKPKISCWDWCTMCKRSIIWRRNARPDLTTLQACLSRPMSYSSSLREQTLLSLQSWRREQRRLRLSAGRHSWPATVSISIPRDHYTCRRPFTFVASHWDI